MSPEWIVAIAFWAIGTFVFVYARFVQWRLERAEDRDALARALGLLP